MNDWNIGLSTGCFYEISVFDCMEDIKNAGFSTVEISSSATHLDYHDMKAVKQARQMMTDLRLELYSLHAPFGSAIDITSPDSTERERSYQELLMAAKAAVDLGVRYLVIHPGPEKNLELPCADYMERLENAAKVFDSISRFCTENNVELVLENALPHLLFGNMRDMLWILGAISNTHVGACLDTGHAALARTLDIIPYKLSGYLQYIHAHDNNGGDDDHLPPGSGTIDWRKLLGILKTTGFKGSFILELAGNQKRSRAEVLADACRGRIFLRDLFKEMM
jgi:sugar phosphate isomerase/epimerase